MMLKVSKCFLCPLSNQIVLACLMALAAAIESEAVVEVADLDVAEHRRHGGYYGGYGGYGGGYYGGYRGGWHRGYGRKRRSVEEDTLSSDLEAAEGRRRGWGHRGGYGGWGGHRGGFGGYGGYGGYGYYG